MPLVPHLPLKRFYDGKEPSSLIAPFFYFLAENCPGSAGYSLSGRLEGSGKNHLIIHSTEEGLEAQADLVLPSLGTLRGDPWTAGFEYVVFDETHPQHFRELLDYLKGMMHGHGLSLLNRRGVAVFAPGSAMPEGHCVAHIDKGTQGLMFYGFDKLPATVRGAIEEKYGALERR